MVYASEAEGKRKEKHMQTNRKDSGGKGPQFKRGA